RQAAEALTDLNTGSFGFIEAPDLSRWLPFLYQAGGQIIDEQGRVVLDGPPARAALDFYVQVYRDNFAGHPGESNSTWAGEVLGKGEGGMAVEGNWVAPYFAAEFPDFRYGVAPLPAGPAGRGTVAFTSCFGVAARSQNPDAAFALVAHLASPEAQARWPEDGSAMPPQPGLMDSWKEAFPHLAAFADAVDEARVWQFPPGFEAFLHSFNRGMAELLAANIEAEDLLAEMQGVAEDMLKMSKE
ncbi:MAG: extracellular solute-binding protein, partial [Caldilineae bacterium]